MRNKLFRPTTLVMLVIALGFALRLFRLDAQSFWCDEAMSAGIARGTVAQIVGNDLTDVHPWLYYVVLHYWLAVSESDFAMRLLSCMLGVAGIAVIYALGRALFNELVGLLAAAMTALSPYHVFYSQETRMYALLFVLSSAVLLAYVRLGRTGSRRWWLAYTVALILSVYVHYLSALLVLSVHLHFLVHETVGRTQWRRLAISDAVLAVAFAPQLLTFVGQAQHIASKGWIPHPTLAQLFSAPHSLTLSQFVSEGLVPYAFAAVLFLFIIVHLQAMRELVRRGGDSAPLALLLLVFWGPLLLSFFLSSWRSIYVERSLMVAVPALYVLLSWGAIQTRERYVNLALLVALGLFATSALRNWYFDPDFGKPPLRTAAQFVRGEVTADEPIVHTSDGAYLVFLHYAADCNNYLIEGDPAAPLPMESYRGFGGETIAREKLYAQPFWLVIALDNSIQFQEGLADWFAHHYRLLESYHFGGINVRYYDDAPSPGVAGS